MTPKYDLSQLICIFIIGFGFGLILIASIFKLTL